MMIVATLKALEENSTDWLKATRITVGITAVILCLIGFMPYTDYSDGENSPKTYIGLENYSERLWIYGAIALTGICAFVLIIKIFGRNKNKLIKSIAITLSIVIVVYGNFIMYLGKLQTGSSGEFIKDYAVNQGEQIDIDDIKNVRSDFYGCVDNLGMYWQIPNIQAFHSIVPGSVMDFYPEFGCSRDVASRPDVGLYGLRSLLSVKYLFDDPTDGDDFDSGSETLMPYWKYYATENGVNIYENQCYIPMGFMYEDFICQEEFELINIEKRDKAILKAMVLSQEQMKKYSDITNYTEGDFEMLDNSNSTTDIVYQGKSTDFVYNESQYKKDCEKLKSQSCSDFKYTNNGFTATINNTGEENLLFFSVPYEDGWTAYVNGEECEIEKVNISFMAVKVPGNKVSEIKFTYRTPGLTTGIVTSIASALVLITYFTVIHIKRKRRKIKIYSEEK
jgi:hypothetical protein